MATAPNMRRSSTRPRPRSLRFARAPPTRRHAGPDAAALSLLDGAALFLDFDGTLVELAETPDGDRRAGRARTLARPAAPAARRPPGHRQRPRDRRSRAASRRLGHRLFGLARARAASCRRHAGCRSRPPGWPRRAGVDASPPPRPACWSRTSRRASRSITASRRTGERAAAFSRRSRRQRGFALQRGKMVAELRPAARQGRGAARLMAEPPFAGARPVFVGDDLTDEDAFEAAAALGGAGVLVGPARGDRGAVAARRRRRGRRLARRGGRGGMKRPVAVADRQLPGQRAGRREAGFVWGCAPRVDGDPLFCSLLEPKGESDGSRAANGGSRSRTRSRSSRAISATRRSWSPGSPMPTAPSPRFSISARVSSARGGCTGRSPSSASSGRSRARRG